MKSVKKMLKKGGTAIGVSASVGSPVEFLADSGFDFILFDTQHSSDEIKELKDEVAATKGRGAIPIVRVGDNFQDQICYALDIGAKGIIIPMVNSKEEAEHAVKCCKYPPVGIRSAAGPRGEWGDHDNFRDHMDTVNDELLVIPMIETVKSMKNLEEILSVPGIDVLLVGPSDLSIALDVTLDYLNPKYQEALDKIAAACKEAGVVPGMYFIPGGQDPSDFVKRGFRFFTLPWTKWASKGVKKGLSKIER